MKFQIEKLVIWPRNTIHAPREISFQLGKVNVITGQSRTGKTAIIPIIDYCLASESCAIPIGVIRDTAEWYGIIISTENEKILLARHAPENSKSSSAFFIRRGQLMEIPLNIKTSNQNEDGVKQLLNTLALIPYTQRDELETGWNKSLSLRDLTHIIFQSQEIIANQSVLFYKAHLTEHREKLKVWMSFILGAETAEMIVAQREYKDVESELKRRLREREKARMVSSEWLQDIIGKLRVAKEYGLYDGHIPDNLSKDKALEIARIVISNRHETSHATADTLTQSRKDIQKLEKQEADLSEKIAIIRKRQKDIDALIENICGFQNGTRRKVERLGISDWLQKNRQAANACPICGEQTHSSANAEIDKICTALRRYEETCNAPLDLPPSFQREKDELATALRSETEQMQDLRSRYDVLRAKDNESAKYQQQVRDMFTLLGTLQSTVQLIERFADEGDSSERIRALEERRARLRKIIDTSTVKTRLDRALETINTATLMRLKTLDVDPDYCLVPPQFSEKELNIRIQDKDGTWHWLPEVGSASNWVSFHVALTCALQEFFIQCTNPPSSVPSFVVFDQPSQVYFPKTRTTDEPNDDPMYDDKDINAVRQIFKTISDSVREANGAWQAIILDHAGMDIYGGIQNVVEVEEWRKGKKLIPEEWYL